VISKRGRTLIKRGRAEGIAAAFFARIGTLTALHLHVGRARLHPVALRDSESGMDQTWSFRQTERGIKVIQIANNILCELAFPVENTSATLRASERGCRFGQDADAGRLSTGS